MSRLPRWRSAARLAFGLLALSLLAWALATQAGPLGHALARLDPTAVVTALLCGLLALAVNLLSWRALVDSLGVRLGTRAAANVFLLGQLAKYVPGSVWVVLAQVDLGRRHGLDAARSTLAAAGNLYVNLTTGASLAALGVAFTGSGVFHRYYWISAFALLGLVFLYPPVMGAVLRWAFRLTRRSTVPPTPRARPLAVAVGFSLAMWLLFGVQTWVLARGLGATAADVLPLSVAAYALAWSVGFLILLAPAGVGARDAVLTVVMTAALPHDAALALALASRGLATIGDLLTAGVGWVAGRRPPPAP